MMTPEGEEVMEHRYIMEQIVGRKLDTDETVHHINEIKTDNDPSNLEIKWRDKHQSFHQQMKRRRG